MSLFFKSFMLTLLFASLAVPNCLADGSGPPLVGAPSILPPSGIQRPPPPDAGAIKRMREKFNLEISQPISRIPQVLQSAKCDSYIVGIGLAASPSITSALCEQHEIKKTKMVGIAANCHSLLPSPTGRPSLVKAFLTCSLADCKMGAENCRHGEFNEQNRQAVRNSLTGAAEKNFRSLIPIKTGQQ